MNNNQPFKFPKWLSNYTVISELGRGAFSTVFKIKSNHTANIYCLKKISLKKTGSKINNEVIINQRLNHINLVKFIDSHFDDDYIYIILEFCEFGDLYSLLRSVNKYIDENIIWDIAYQSLLALEYLHSQKIIHRDIKLLNIFMTTDKLVKIGDMGMSKLIDDSTKMNHSRVGTPLYLAPELVNKQPYDYKIDIWSFGCSLYHLAKCVPPFNEENLLKLGHAIVHDEPPSLPELYSNNFKSFVSYLMRKSKENRPTATMALRYIPEKIKKNYQEKFADKLNKVSLATSNNEKKILCTSSNNYEATLQQSLNTFINSKISMPNELIDLRKKLVKRTPSESLSIPNNYIGHAGGLLKKQFKVYNDNNKAKKANATQDNFHPHSINNIKATTDIITKESQDKNNSSSKNNNPPKVQTCNNFYNFNINLYKVNYNKNKIPPPSREDYKQYINNKLETTTTAVTDKVVPESIIKIDNIHPPHCNSNSSNGLTNHHYNENTMNHNKIGMNQSNNLLFPMIKSSKILTERYKDQDMLIFHNNNKLNTNKIRKSYNSVMQGELIKKPKVLTINDLK